MPPRHQSHGSGAFRREDLRACGPDCIFEAGVLVFHPENVALGANVYVGHQTILKGYYKNLLQVGDETWIGQQGFFHAAGGLRIGARVGIGPGVRIITSTHREAGRGTPILFAPVDLAPVLIEDDADLGVGAVVLPGVTVGRGALVGAGAVVADNIPPFAVAAGVPARILRYRPDRA